jgi:DnaK suppressor protein
VSPLLVPAQESLISRRDVLRRTARELSSDERREVEEIDAALERIASGDWGRCELCSGAIGRSRLRAMPETRRCAHCEE